MASIGERLHSAAMASNDPDARLDAELLLAHVLGRPRSWLFAYPEAELADTDGAAFDALLARRAAGEPVAHLVGRRGFWRLELAVTADTLVPRPETELLVELALERIGVDAASDVLDLGTGTGAVALAIAQERPRARVVAVDTSEAALRVARGNAVAHGLDRVELVRSDWFAALSGRRFDVVVGNPPYLATDDPHLAGELRHEPLAALVSGADGLDAIRRIVVEALAFVAADGWLLLEHGNTQGAAVRALFEAAGWRAVKTDRDLEGRDRVTSGMRGAD